MDAMEGYIWPFPMKHRFGCWILVRHDLGAAIWKFSKKKDTGAGSNKIII